MKELKIIHIDPVFIVVNKPGGLLAVPGRGADKQDCVVTRIKAMFPGCIEQPAVHRLDMYTSGIMLLARTKEAHRQLSIQFEQRAVEKEYAAVLDGAISGIEGRIELAFRLDPDNRPHQVYDPVRGKTGISNWRKTGEEKGKTHVLFSPLTGRTHQLRLHSAHPLGLGVPIVGDALYGNGTEGEKMLLHACRLSFFHPVNGERLEFFCEPDF